MAIPTPADFFLKTGAYDERVFETHDEHWEVLKVLQFVGTYDAYCVLCERESTFRGMFDPELAAKRDRSRETAQKKIGARIPLPIVSNGTYVVAAGCTRITAHEQHFIFHVDSKTFVDANAAPPVRTERRIRKIGQQPSYGDLRADTVKGYSAVLTKAQLGELTRANGLASHDVGIGSYVYLRRVFEALVEEAHLAAAKDPGWDDETYGRSRMSEKIALLKNHLPIFLVEHAAMYSLLSKGVHELSEQECLKHFDTLRLGIEMILDQKLEEKTRAAKQKQASDALRKALGEASRSTPDPEARELPG